MAINQFIGLKPKQIEAMKAFRSGRYNYLCHAGTAGSGKTFFDLGLLHILAANLPGTRFAIFRKSEKNLKQTTIPSYRKMKAESKSVGDSQIVDFTARYRNGSEILFCWADPTKDPDLDNIKGLECTGILFEEANQIDKRYFEIAKTRIGRWNNHLCPPFILLNLNPSIGWVKDLFYENWVNGTLPPRHYFLEFDEQDAVAASGKGYVRLFDSLPEQERNRFVKNRWDYSDIPNQLIKYEWYKQCIVYSEYIDDPTTRNLLAIDPAWEGDDATVFASLRGSRLGQWDSYPKQDPDFSGTLGFQKAKDLRVQEGDLIVDPVGIGAATVLTLRNKHNFEPDMHLGNDEPTDMFGVLKMFNKRSEAHWLLREALRLQEISVEHDPEFMRQAVALKYSIDEKKFRVRPKKEIKAEIGVSPGHVDVATMLVHRWKTTTTRLALELAERQEPSALSIGEMTRAEADRARIMREQREWQ